MKNHFCLTLAGASGLLFAISPTLRAQAGDAEAAKVVTEIKELRKLFTEGSGKNNDRALTAIRNAMASPKATYEFYMESRKKLDFDEKGKRESDWREWRDKNEDRYKESDHLRARQFQLRYLALSVEAASAGSDDKELAKVIPSLTTFLDDMTAAAGALAAQQGVLKGSVLSSTFARRMKLDLTLDKKTAWCFAPMDIEQIYETTVLPYYRRAGDGRALDGVWDKRMIHEAKLAVLPQENMRDAIGNIPGVDNKQVDDLIRRFGGGRGGSREREREERREDERTAELGEASFRSERLPELKWGKARDALFFGTDRVASLRAMSSLFKQNMNHENARAWLDELTALAEQTDYDHEEYYGAGG